MKKLCKRWIAKPFLFLIFGSLTVAGNLAQAATPCDIELSQPIYQTGEVVQLNVFRLTNSSPEAQLYEWKLWIESPFQGVTSLVNFGANSELVLTGGFDVDFASLVGPVELFTIDGVIFFPGTYTIGCRLLDPMTGAEYPDADVIVFEVQ